MRRTVIGVAGGSQTGKTTLAWGLEDRLGADVSVLWFDEYYHDLVHLTPDERALVNYDHPDSLDVDLLVSHLDGLLAGRPAEVPVYDFTTHTRTGTTRRVDPRPVIVVDGILVLAFPVIRERLDVSVFVEAPAEVRLARRLDRDVRERGRTPESVRTQFAATVAPMHDAFVSPCRDLADLTLDGQGDLVANLGLIVDRLDAVSVASGGLV
ncbi:MAG: uridine kinase [Acidimicrobiales bacterium]|nr:uridine kinase [Acidimicrobiales bacterium]